MELPVRVPTILVSPLIEAGTVFRVPDGTTPLDHTSVLKTIELRWGLPNLTARDAAAPDIGAVLVRSAPRTDDPLQGVQVPHSSGTHPAADAPSHLQQVHAELVSQLLVPDAAGHTHHTMPPLHTASEYEQYIQSRTEAWKATRE